MKRKDLILVASGKTKKIWQQPGNPNGCVVQSLDQISANDGRRLDIFEGKGALSHRVTCNVFKYLSDCEGIPLAYREPCGPNSFIASMCRMVPLEVVCRFSAHPKGSYTKRNPNLIHGAQFHNPVVEFFLKTKQRMWKGITLPADDMFIDYHSQEFARTSSHGEIIPLDCNTHGVYRPDCPISDQKPEFSIHAGDLGITAVEWRYINDIAHKTGLALRAAWKSVECNLIDFKMEFGRDARGNIVVADVIDHDSWRLIDYNGVDLSKQAYRDGETEAVVMERFRRATELSESFKNLKQAA